MKISVKGIDKVNLMLTKLSNQLDIIANEIIRKLAEQGYAIANYRFDRAEYDGTNDVQVDWVETDTLKVQLMAWGKSALFIEFGAGITHYDGYPNRPKGVDPIGEYHLGQGRGKQRYWVFKNYNINGNTTSEFRPVKDKQGKDRPNVYWTSGNQPARAMYNAEITMRHNIKQVAMEVVSKYVRH